MLAFLFAPGKKQQLHSSLSPSWKKAVVAYSHSLQSSLDISMASTSSSHMENDFSGIEPDSKRRKVEQSSRLFDVFINHGGPDVKHTLATQLYRALEKVNISAFIDSEEKEFGTSFPRTIEAAILSASAHIAIFSKGYAHSPWCLAELDLMLQSTGKIIPVFYQVEPWELRHIEKGVYKDAFLQYEEKGRYIEKIKEWKGALQSVSFTTGYEIKDPDSSDCREIVSAVEKEVQRTKHLHVARYLEDFEIRCLRDLVQDFESQCGMNSSGDKKPKFVGIFGMGGVGKTTLSKEFYNQNRSQFSKQSFLSDVREASARGELSALQSELLGDIFDESHNFVSIEEGKSCLKDRFQRSCSLSFLIVLDDIDHVDQLEALIPLDLLTKHDDYLVVITTRDVGVLVMAGIDTGYHLKGLNLKDGKELFCWYAFRQPHPCSGYEDLVNTFVKVCGGLPLSLKVLGRHVFGQDLPYWREELRKLSKTLPGDVKKRLKISINSLDYKEQYIFMDVACFFIGKSASMAERIWEASGWRPYHALKKLEDKCLLESYKIFKNRRCDRRVPLLKIDLKTRQDSFYWRMHDHLQDLGREMANESYPRRVWQPQHLQSLELEGFQNILAQTRGRCFQSIWDESMGCKITYFLDSDFYASLLWLQLDYGPRPRGNINASIPSWIPLQNLQCLSIKNGCFQRLWQSDVKAPSRLKELRIRKTYLKEFPDLSGMSDDIKDVVLSFEEFEMDVSFLLGSLGMNPRSLSMRDSRFTGNTTKGATFQSSYINDFKPILEGEVAFNNERWSRTIMKEVKNLEIKSCNLVTKILITGICCQRLQSLQLCYLKNLIEVDLARIWTLNSLCITYCEKFKRLPLATDFIRLKYLCIRACPELEELPGLAGQNCLKEIEIDNCEKLQNIMLPMALIKLTVRSCRYLQRVGVDGDIVNLSRLRFRGCPELQELPWITRLSSLEVIDIVSCDKLENITLPTTLLKNVAANGDFTKLTQLYIRECPELQELPCLARVSSLKEILIESCDKLHDITLPTTVNSLHVRRCRKMQNVAVNGDLIRMWQLKFVECPELEELPCLASDSRIFIESCDKLQFITLPTTVISLHVRSCRNMQSVTVNGDLIKLRRLYFKECPELQELPCLAGVGSFEQILIESCDKLHDIMLPTTVISLHVKSCRKMRSVAINGDLTKLRGLDIREYSTLEVPRRYYIKECPELQELTCLARVSYVEEIVIKSCDKLHDITLPTTVISLHVKSCIKLRSVAVNGDLIKLRRLYLKECHELQELPCLARVSSLEEIVIDSCDKLQDITLSTTVTSLNVQSCRKMQSVTVNGDLTKLRQLYIKGCPELQELPRLCRVSCLEKIVIESCEKLQSLSGIEELQASEYFMEMHS